MAAATTQGDERRATRQIGDARRAIRQTWTTAEATRRERLAECMQDELVAVVFGARPLLARAPAVR